MNAILTDSSATAARASWMDHLDRLASVPLGLLAQRRGGEMPRRGFLLEDELRRDQVPVALLECVGRLACGIAPWLETHEPDERELRERMTHDLAASLSSLMDPASPDFCPMDAHSQTLVDMAFVAQALLRSPRVLRGALSEDTRTRLVGAMQEVCRLHVPGQNNWLLFTACCQALLRAWEEEHQPTLIDYAIRMHATWYLGDGIYGDGPHFHYDYYNSYVIQPMMLDILNVDKGRGRHPAWFGAIDPERAIERLTRWAEIQERQIARDGTFPVVGRSIVYRSGAFHGLAAAALHHCLPESIIPAQVRCALSAVHEMTLGVANSFDESGWLTIGLAGKQPDLGEGYISTGSCYLTSTSFLPLGLPASDPFWSTPDAPWSAQRLWAGENLPADHALRS